MKPKFRELTGVPNYKINEEDPDLVPHFISVNQTVPSYYMIEGKMEMQKFQELMDTHYPNHLVSWRYEMDKVVQMVVQIEWSKQQVVFIRTGRSGPWTDCPGQIVFDDLDLLYDIRHGRPDDLIDQLKTLVIAENKKVAKINLVCHDQDIGLYTRSFQLPHDRYDVDLDLYYGDGMSDFHTKQMKRLMSGNKGIMLLYGDPGTGKTTYIKKLCSELMESNKKILYLPNNMIDQLGTPSFNNFLLEWSEDEDTNNGILVIIEDGERVLLRRENNPFGSDGVSNILNTTDGILNDFLNIQVLATFNTDIRNIDPAILRKKRTLGIREFKLLPIESAQRLVDHLGYDHRVDQPMSLADIFSLDETEQDDRLFEHGQKNDPKIGF